MLGTRLQVITSVEWVGVLNLRILVQVPQSVNVSVFIGPLEQSNIMNNYCIYMCGHMVLKSIIFSKSKMLKRGKYLTNSIFFQNAEMADINLVSQEIIM